MEHRLWLSPPCACDGIAAAAAPTVAAAAIVSGDSDVEERVAVPSGLRFAGGQVKEPEPLKRLVGRVVKIGRGVAV
jgi:hypothetical protein